MYQFGMAEYAIWWRWCIRAFCVWSGREVYIFSVGQSYGMRASLVWFFGNIYVPDAELLQMYIFKSYIEEKLVILLPDWFYFGVDCDWAEHSVIWPQQRQCPALNAAFHSDLSLQSLASQTIFSLGSFPSPGALRTQQLWARSHKDLLASSWKKEDPPYQILPLNVNNQSIFYNLAYSALKINCATQTFAWYSLFIIFHRHYFISSSKKMTSGLAWEDRY